MQIVIGGTLTQKPLSPGRSNKLQELTAWFEYLFKIGEDDGQILKIVGMLRK